MAKRTEEQKATRRAIYRQLRDQGYTSAQAKRLRDVKPENRSILGRQGRIDNFRKWSGGNRRNRLNQGFPPEIRQRIEQYNRAHGEVLNARYGYKRFWHEYVDEQSPAEAIRIAESSDT